MRTGTDTDAQGPPPRHQRNSAGTSMRSPSFLAAVPPPGLVLPFAGGNRAVTAAVQRYRTTRAPKKGSQFEAEQIKPTIGGDGIGYGAAETSQQLHISDDGLMAVQGSGHPKEAFLDDGVLARSNNMLAENPVQLVTSGTPLRLGGRTLTRVVPGENGEVMAGMAVNECIAVARHVMGLGEGVEGMTAKFDGEQAASSPTIKTANKPHERAASWLLGNDDGHPLSGAVPDDPGLSKRYGRALGKGKLNQRARLAGLNQFANAGVGEGYVTYSMYAGDATEKSGQQDFAAGGIEGEIARMFGGSVRKKGTWKMHWAAVVAASGGDRVTLENYNRTEELNGLKQQWYDKLMADKERLGLAGLPDHGTTLWLKAAFAQLNPAKVANDLLGVGAAGRAWYFALYGSGQGQSFHERSHKGGDTLNPVTFAVRPEAKARV